jgi:hypothetical protein
MLWAFCGPVPIQAVEEYLHALEQIEVLDRVGGSAVRRRALPMRDHVGRLVLLDDLAAGGACLLDASLQR